MDLDQAKLFVGGISWETSEETLQDHFNKYGDVVESVIMRDKNTGSARGFGFVLFSDPSVADKALQDKHVILGRTVEVKKAVPRGDQHHHPHQQQTKGSSRNSSNDGNGNQFRTKKIFVGGLSSSLTEEEFKSYFEKFGRITDVVVMYDSVTHRPRGFGFITFDSEEAVESVMQKNFHELNDKFVEVKRAVPKDGNSSGNGNGTNTNTRAGGGRGSLCGSYRGVVHPSYSPRYWMFPGYTPPPLPGFGGIGGYPYGANTYGGGYSIGGYSGIGYGTPPIAVPRSPWYGPAMVGARQSPVLYGDSAIYPGYMNGGVGGVLGMTAGDHLGIIRPAANGKWNQGIGGDTQVPANTMPPQNDGGKLEDDPTGFSGSNGAGTVKQNKRGPDGRHSSCPITNAS
ncbi:heterogeneous nuclear ribonucleoprotein 1-like [Telopea speciosissima]|uniref:heterogeneous nuclear ribonucleoprotein 1-like n=1 Tax=Telopea speciosissima TaxID=54955 RepID=UPI001CC68723|nr:heterogeneous nuclear ribonucleoprotein 1-like [Telopea speciosissima]